MKTLLRLLCVALCAGCASTPVAEPPPAAEAQAHLAVVAPPAPPPANVPEHPTFNRDVAPILFKRCVGCHRPGEVAPFPLLSYEDAAKRAQQLVRVTHNRYMPPWKPAPGFNEFKNPRSLTDAEIATIAAWAEGGTPQGDPAELPEAPKFADGWQLGTPDLVIKVPERFTVPAEGQDLYQCFVIPMNVAEDRQVAAIEFRADNRRVVHHALLYLDNKGAARKNDAASPEQGYKCFGGPGFLATGMLGGWAPGAVPRLLPEGIARELPKNSDLVIQLHYHPDGKVETDQSQVGLFFSKVPAKKSLHAIPLAKLDLEIPAGDSHYRTGISFTLPLDMELVGIAPHMHLLGQEMKVTATLPDGSVKPLIYIEDWDFNWQGEYAFKETMRLPKGTRLDLEAIYDNSENNPNNPHHPPRKVTWGENTTDEMAIAFVQYVTDDPESRKLIRKEMFFQLQLWRVLGRLKP